MIGERLASRTPALEGKEVTSIGSGAESFVTVVGAAAADGIRSGNERDSGNRLRLLPLYRS